MSELKSCPFCSGDMNSHHVTCYLSLVERIFNGEDIPSDMLSTSWNTRADDWLPIESAPHNICLLLLSGEVQYVGFYADKYTLESGSDDDDFEYNESDDTFYCAEGWYETQNNWGDYRAIAAHDYPPTHWMPLPKQRSK